MSDVPRIALLALAVALPACAAKKPVLYPNATYQATGAEVAQLDIEDCMKLAEAGVDPEGAASKTAKNAAGGGAAGGAVGAVGGAIVGSAGRGAAVGAATGATAGLFRGLFRSHEPDPIFQRYVERCLRDQGYEPIGWR